MQNRPMANNIFQCDFSFQPLLHALPLVILALQSREVLQGKTSNHDFSKKHHQKFLIFGYVVGNCQKFWILAVSFTEHFVFLIDSSPTVCEETAIFQPKFCRFHPKPEQINWVRIEQLGNSSWIHMKAHILDLAPTLTTYLLLLWICRHQAERYIPKNIPSQNNISYKFLPCHLTRY